MSGDDDPLAEASLRVILRYACCVPAKRTHVYSDADFPMDCYRANLSNAAYRTHHEGLNYSNRYMLDGLVPKSDMRRFAGSEDYVAAIDQLVACGFWLDTADCYRIVAHIEDQPSKDQVVARRAAGRERGRSRRSPEYVRLRSEIKQGAHCCARCGATDDLEVDHKHPLTRGGDESEENLQVLCGRCNSSKGNTTYAEWRRTEP